MRKGRLADRLRQIILFSLVLTLLSGSMTVLAAAPAGTSDDPSASCGATQGCVTESQAESQEEGSRETAAETQTCQPQTQQEAVKPLAKPGIPQVKVSSHTTRAYLTWKKTKHAVRYYVYRRLAGKRGYTLIGKTRKRKYTDKKVKAGKTYVYKVRAVNEKNGRTRQSKASAAARIRISAIDPKKKMIALTFDDGPGPYTKAIVSCLKKYGMHATFFVVGNRVSSYRSALKAAYSAGCEIGNHSWDHADLASLSASDIRDQVSKTDKAVKAVTGKKPVLLRPPYGSVSSRVKKSAGKPMINWSVDTLDWKTRSKPATVSSVMNNAGDGQIVLMHDIHSPTKSAALTLIPRLVKKGYQLVTVSELARYKGKKLRKGNLYYSIH